MRKRIYVETSCLGDKYTGISKTIDSLLRSFDDVGIEYYRTCRSDNQRFRSFLYYNFYLRSFCRKRLNSNDVFLIPNNMGKFWILPHVNTWVIVHDLIPLTQYGYKGIKKFMYKWKMSRLRKASKIIVISEYVKKKLCDEFKIDSSKIDVLYWQSDEVAISKGRRSKFYLSIGTGEPRKNVEFLIKHWMELNTNKDLLLFGKEWKKGSHTHLKKLIKTYKAQDRIKILGVLTDKELAELYSTAAALIFPSLEEGFGLPPLEALSHGCNVILPKTPINYELYKEVAQMYSIGSVEELRKCIINAVDDNTTENVSFSKRYGSFAFQNRLKEIFM